MMDTVKKLLSDLHPHERNVRRHNRRQISEMIKAINSYGVIRPIVVDENNTILCGHGLYEALLEKGEDSADCLVMSGLSEKQKKKLMLADNKIYDLGTSDFEVIDELLKEFGLEGDFSVPGYDEEYLEDLYGMKSVKKAAEEMAQKPIIPEPESEPNDTPAFKKDAPPVPSARVQEERQRQLEAKRVIVCPHCGEVIEL